MGKALFIPVSVAAGFAAAFAGKKVFEILWGVVDDQEPPDAEHREVQMPKMIAALALQGAIFSVTRGLTDRAARMAFYRATGAWPGEQQPEQV